MYFRFPLDGSMCLEQVNDNISDINIYDLIPLPALNHPVFFEMSWAILHGCNRNLLERSGSL